MWSWDFLFLEESGDEDIDIQLEEDLEEDFFFFAYFYTYERPSKDQEDLDHEEQWKNFDGMVVSYQKKRVKKKFWEEMKE